MICVSGKYVYLSNAIVAITVTQRDIQWRPRGEEEQCAPCADASARAVAASFRVSITAALWMVMASDGKDALWGNLIPCIMRSASASMRGTCTAEVIRQKPKTIWQRFLNLFRKQK